MTSKTISVDIVSSNALPVQMTYEYFFKRITEGYFQVKKRSMKKMKDLLMHLGKNQIEE